MSTPRKPATEAIHAGSRLPESSAIPITPAIHTAAVSWFDSSDELDAALDGNDFVYTRIRGENPVLLEEAVAALEGAEASAVSRQRDGRAPGRLRCAGALRPATGSSCRWTATEPPAPSSSASRTSRRSSSSP